MADQRARTRWVREGCTGDPRPEEAKWRPFQIAFVLLCLRGIAEPEHSERHIADLLWFPTGGGKTEAYLGLIAFTVFLRRLENGPRGAGTTVLMRYTLRLLTLQQVERAAVLMCAMELLRLGDRAALGEEEMSLGMWVGRSATPNSLKVAAEKLRELRSGETLLTENPVQLHACPWCGTALDAHQYRVDEAAVRMRIECPGTGCAFHSGLPVHLVDEAVYRWHPTLVVATVDKFASLPWDERTAALFNRDTSPNLVDGTPPPELIVQDELHLISGPLGSLTGLYETAVDLLADRPKVIASTATIRRAHEQGRGLFTREVVQFPPSGVDSRDSWFAVETPAEQKASRAYVGLLAPGTSQASLLIRTYASLMQRAVDIETADESVRDAYYTLVGYFNSLRLLSAAELQVHDDVVAYIGHLAEREGSKPRDIENVIELSSRASAAEVPDRLRRIQCAHPSSDVVDVLLATNMISVGVDIDRLGLMAVMGQPQTTAEYIQATSRVGRSRPGLIAVMLNSSRSRDRSHYEDFAHYHSALYREVEATSVTPFSSRARERGLHAVVVALVRMLIPEARPNDAAGRVRDFRDTVEQKIFPLILARVRMATEDKREVSNTHEDLVEFLDWWEEQTEVRGNLTYARPPGSKAPCLLADYDDDPDLGGLPTLRSLRDVDAESPLFLEATQ